MSTVDLWTDPETPAEIKQKVVRLEAPPPPKKIGSRSNEPQMERADALALLKEIQALSGDNMA